MSPKYRYISLFSGAGGLEFPESKPEVFCELDSSCHDVLRRRFKDVDIHSDVRTLVPPRADVVVGGWPCQDISVAGKQRGLSGKNSGLFYHMPRIAKASKARIIVAENVPNLIRMGGGSMFRQVLSEFRKSGFPVVAWRVLNARQFGLPQQRKRVLMVATKDIDHVWALFRDTSFIRRPRKGKAVEAAGFYTTAGSRSICYSRGYVPTLKVGSSLSIPGPPGLFYYGVVRKASMNECIRLQGFSPKAFLGVNSKDVFRMMGNAVPLPIGHFVTSGLSIKADRPEMSPEKEGHIGDAGVAIGGEIFSIKIDLPARLAENLGDFIDAESEERLSQRAASGLLRRLRRSGITCPAPLVVALERCAI